ncbi:hypothetical protein C8Q73DRAFT_119794 [Cubamyces lactineus]|nr:hypothetical protein C8Q73DRAFT_119794 [Cubamyces lactineus]
MNDPHLQLSPVRSLSEVHPQASRISRDPPPMISRPRLSRAFLCRHHSLHDLASTARCRECVKSCADLARGGHYNNVQVWPSTSSVASCRHQCHRSFQRSTPRDLELILS